MQCRLRRKVRPSELEVEFLAASGYRFTFACQRIRFAPARVAFGYIDAVCCAYAEMPGKTGMLRSTQRQQPNVADSPSRLPEGASTRTCCNS